MADRFACWCVTCPKCGSWVVLSPRVDAEPEASKIRIGCAAPDCGNQFEFDWDEIRTFELPLALFERRHFYHSELQGDLT